MSPTTIPRSNPIDIKNAEKNEKLPDPEPEVLERPDQQVQQKSEVIEVEEEDDFNIDNVPEAEECLPTDF